MNGGKPSPRSEIEEVGTVSEDDWILDHVERFGVRPAETGLFWINGGEAREPGVGMLNEEQIAEIVAYERQLQSATQTTEEGE